METRTDTDRLDDEQGLVPEELRLRAEGGDVQALEQLWWRLEPRLRRIAAASAFQAAPKHMDRLRIVDDALDEVRAALRDSLVGSTSSLIGYLARQTRWRVRSQVRREAVRTRHIDAAIPVDDIVETRPGVGNDPEGDLIDRENQDERLALARMLLVCIDAIEASARFGARQMTAFRLRFVDEIAVESIAERLAVSKRTAEYAIEHGREALRKCLSGKHGLREPGTLVPRDGSAG